MSCLGTVLTFGLGAASVIVAAGVFATSTPAAPEQEPDYRPQIIYEDRTITKKEVVTNTPESCLSIPELAEDYRAVLFELNSLVSKNERLVSEAQQAAGAGQSSADYIAKTRDHADQVAPLKVGAHDKRMALEGAVSRCQQESE